MSKQLHTAHAAWAGLQSAALASVGMTGPAAILEGERGFYAAMCGDVDQQAVVRHEQDWLIHETSFKPWPACRHTHAVIDCALALRSCAGSDAKLFERCDVYTFDDAVTICDDASPATRIQAKFSLQYCVTAAYLSGPLQLRHFEPQAMAERSVREAMRRVHLYRDAAMTARYPAHFGARVALTGPKGQRLVHEESDALGDPERALSSSQIIDKARALLAYGRVDPSVIDRLLVAVSTLLSGSASDFPTVLTAPFNDPSHNLETRLPVRET